MVSQPQIDRQAVHDELEAARATFHALADHASKNELDRRSAGTRWTNRQLLFHMLFGYLIVRTLLGLVRGLGRLPPGFGRTWSRVLNSATRPFHVVNYLGSVGGALVLRGPWLTAKLDRVVAARRGVAVVGGGQGDGGAVGCAPAGQGDLEVLTGGRAGRDDECGIDGEALGTVGGDRLTRSTCSAT